MLTRFEKVEAEAHRIRAYVIKQARSNLTRLGKNHTKKLYNSIDGEVVIQQQNIDLIFKMELYGQFQDQGVDGVRVKHGSPFSYKSKMPPGSALDKWIVAKGIAPRDKSGKFLTRKQTQFMIARGIFLKGIKRSLFFTKPFEDAMAGAGKQFVQALNEDVAIYMDEVIKESNKKRKK